MINIIKILYKIFILFFLSPIFLFTIKGINTSQILKIQSAVFRQQADDAPLLVGNARLVQNGAKVGWKGIARLQQADVDRTVFRNTHKKFLRKGKTVIYYELNGMCFKQKLQMKIHFA